MEAQNGGPKPFLISSRPAWVGAFAQENLEPLFALRNFREVEELLSAVCLSYSRSGLASNDFCRFLLMKCGFLVFAVRGGEITMSVDHI